MDYISIDCYQIWIRSAEKSLVLTPDVTDFIATDDNQVNSQIDSHVADYLIDQ